MFKSFEVNEIPNFTYLFLKFATLAKSTSYLDYFVFSTFSYFYVGFLDIVVLFQTANNLLI